MTTFGEWLAGQRKAHGMPVSELARRSGLSQAGVRKIERGDASPSLETADRLTRLGFGVPLWRAVRAFRP